MSRAPAGEGIYDHVVNECCPAELYVSLLMCIIGVRSILVKLSALRPLPGDGNGIPGNDNAGLVV